MPPFQKGFLIDLWGTLFYPSISLEDYHRRRAESLSRVLDMPFDVVYSAYIQARKLSDAVRTWTMREVDVVGEVVLMLSNLGIDPRGELVEELVEAYMSPYVSFLRVAEGAAELLEAARDAGYRVILASNTLSSKHTVQLLESAGLHEYFDFLALSDSIGFRKPHPRFFSYAIHETGISPLQSVFVGDEETDIVGAEQFGMTTVIFTGFHEYSGSAKPSFFVSRLSDIVDIIHGRISQAFNKKTAQ